MDIAKLFVKCKCHPVVFLSMPTNSAWIHQIDIPFHTQIATIFGDILLAILNDTIGLNYLKIYWRIKRY